MLICNNSRPYLPGQIVVSLIYHPPEAQIGTICRVIRRAHGSLFAVRAPGGEIFRWVTLFELEPAHPERYLLFEGTSAFVATDRISPFLNRGTEVQVIKRIDATDYYDVRPVEGNNIIVLPGMAISSTL